MAKKQESTKINNVLVELRKKEINTWFDLGLFIDQFKEQPSKAAFKGNTTAFDSHLEKGGIAFILSILLLTELLLKPKSMPKPLKESTRIFLFII